LRFWLFALTGSGRFHKGEDRRADMVRQLGPGGRYTGQVGGNFAGFSFSAVLSALPRVARHALFDGR
jgi:hypothetical protein